MSDKPLVPEGVLNGIDDIANGKVASKREVIDALKWDSDDN